MKQLLGRAAFVLSVAWLVLSSVGVSAADASSPDLLIKGVTNEVLDIVRKDKDIQSGNTRKAVELIHAKVLPHFNFTHMTQLAMGREARQATPEQMKVLADEFRDLLVRTYSKALSEFRDQEISFRPFRMPPGEDEVRVQTEIKQPSGKPIALDYYLEKSASGWKVFDVEIGGVSLVTNYRSSFTREIQANGVDGLIRALQAKNKKSVAS